MRLTVAGRSSSPGAAELDAEFAPINLSKLCKDPSAEQLREAGACQTLPFHTRSAMDGCLLSRGWVKRWSSKSHICTAHNCHPCRGASWHQTLRLLSTFGGGEPTIPMAVLPGYPPPTWSVAVTGQPMTKSGSDARLGAFFAAVYIPILIRPRVDGGHWQESSLRDAEDRG